MMDWTEIGPVVGAFVIASKALDFAIDAYKTKKNGSIENKIYDKVTGLEKTMAVFGERLGTHLKDHESGKV